MGTMTTWLLGWCIGSAVVGWLLLVCPVRVLRGNLVVALVTVTCFAVALTAGALALALRTYQVFTRETPVATIVCESASGAPAQFRLQYTPSAPATAATQTFVLQGDQWMLSGEILKWHPWLTALGFRTVHKPSRISGRFSRAADERAQPPSAYDLNGGTDAWWVWLHHHGARLPLVEAVYGNSVYTFAEPSHTYTVYITPSGYLVK